MITRRELLLYLSALAALPAHSQQPGRVWRIGFLGVGGPVDMANRTDALRSGLSEAGYQEGRNLQIEYRWAQGRDERMPELARELVGTKPDLIITHGQSGPMALRQTTTSIPIVIAAGGDPVDSGLVTSLARPGGNITGQTFFPAELMAKRMQFLKEFMPRLKRIGALSGPLDDPSSKFTNDAVVSAGKILNISVQDFRVQRQDQITATFAAIGKSKVEALAVSDAVILNINVKTTASLALQQRLPAAGNPEFAELGGLLGYGVNIPAMFHRAAYFVDRILKGANPGEMPIERPTKFDMVVNLKTAKAIGVKIPQSIMLQATKTIE